jgi:hypothetical protein
VTRSAVLALLRHRTVAFVLVAGAGWGAWDLSLRLTAPLRIDPALASALERQPFVNVSVSLGFAPEDFHIRLFQGYGVVSGVQGTSVRVNRVRPDDVWRIARHYWVRRIAPTPES